MKRWLINFENYIITKSTRLIPPIFLYVKIELKKYLLITLFKRIDSSAKIEKYFTVESG